MRKSLRFRELRSLTIPRTPPPSSVEERELQADHEAAPVLQRYLELADIALGVTRRPYVVTRHDSEGNRISNNERAA